VVVTLGADPEVFFEYLGRPVSAIGLIGGSKETPRSTGEDGFFVLEDNVAAEYNIPPATSPTAFSDNVARGLAHVESYAKANDRVLSFLASASFEPKELDNPQAQEFGCMPDYNAWTYAMNEPPHTEDANFRTVGGHVHVGGYPENVNSVNLIRCMDLFLGVPSIILDKDKDRRKLYGKAGAFRVKDYGVEYRTLSNFWIFSSVNRLWVWNATQKAIAFAANNTIETDGVIGEIIKHTINESDADGYYSLLKEYPDIGV